MNNLRWIYSLLLLTIILSASASMASDEIQVIYIFGKVEALRKESNQWEFLKRDAKLSSDDLIRMPPISLFRIKEKDGISLPIFYGGRELRVSQLIAEGRKRLATPKVRRLGADLDGGMAIDILPTGNSVSEKRLQPQKASPEETTKISHEQLQHLRSLLQNPSESIRTYALKNIDNIPKQNDDSASRRLTVYPGENILEAWHLFDVLRSAMTALRKTKPPVSEANRFENLDFKQVISDDAIEFMTLYGQMLTSYGIKADFVTNSRGELFLIFDSGIKQNEIGRITANWELVYFRGQNLWIPISVSDLSNNFTRAWYEGSGK